MTEKKAVARPRLEKSRPPVRNVFSMDSFPRGTGATRRANARTTAEMTLRISCTHQHLRDASARAQESPPGEDAHVQPIRHRARDLRARSSGLMDSSVRAGTASSAAAAASSAWPMPPSSSVLAAACLGLLLLLLLGSLRDARSWFRAGVGTIKPRTPGHHDPGSAAAARPARRHRERIVAAAC